MRRFLPLFALIATVACEGVGGTGPIDVEKFLQSSEGPKVPTMQDALLDSAKKSEDQGDFTQAAAYYQQALQKHPDDKNITLSLADAQRRANNFDAAITVYDQLLAKDANMAAALEGKGLALMGKGDFETPVDLLQQALKADPKRWKTLNALGILFATRNMNTEAQQYFTEASKQSPNNPSIFNNMGLAQALSHNFNEAIASLNKADTLTTANSSERKRIELNQALVYAIAGRLDDAKAIAAQYYAGPALDNNLGLYAHLAKDDQLAKAHLNMALTNSKVFYERAWNNLQSINESNRAQPMRAPAKTPKKKPSEKTLTAPDQ